MENNELIKYKGGLINRVGNAISVTNKLLSLTEPQLIPYHKRDKWDFCTADKKILINCIYDSVNPFYEGLASVKMGRWGFVNKSGDTIVDFRTYQRVGDFSEGMATVELVGGRSGFIDKNGNEVIACIYGHTFPFSEGVAAVIGSPEIKVGFVDKLGNLVIQKNFDDEADVNYYVYTGEY